MAKRVTIMLDDGLVSKLRKTQSEQIRKSDKNVSFSHVINEILRKATK